MMAEEPDDIIPVRLRDIRGMKIDGRRTTIEKQLDNYKKIVRYSPGPSSGTQLRQAQQESRIDALFEKLAKLLSDKMPV
jgi:hypothetical protein